MERPILYVYLYSFFFFFFKSRKHAHPHFDADPLVPSVLWKCVYYIYTYMVYVSCRKKKLRLGKWGHFRSDAKFSEHNLSI